MKRREFLLGTLGLGATVAAAGCVNARRKLQGVIDLNPDSYRKNKEPMKM